MGRQKRKPIYYTAHSLYDGTVIAVFPIRKPYRERLKIDEDGVCREWLRGGRELAVGDNENKFRFQDIIATRLNTRRAVREMVCQILLKMQKDMDNVCITNLTIFSNCSRGNQMWHRDRQRFMDVLKYTLLLKVDAKLLS